LIREEDIMKKIVLASLFAIGVIALSQQQASAWVNTKFGIGLNYSHQSGGNNFGWGLWQNGQVPGPEAFGGGGGYYGGGGGGGGGGYYGGGGFPSYAPSAPCCGGSGAQQFQAPMPKTTSDYSTPQNPYAGVYYYNSPYQLASYPQQPAYYYYAPPNYYYGR